MDTSREEERIRMVRDQIEARGVRDPHVLSAMRSVPRHLFVPESHAREAYADHPLPIGNGQTISQPYIVAVMTELLAPAPGDTILEIGTGSGYQAAILATCGVRVISVERIGEVSRLAEENLRKAGISGVTIITGDGTEGCLEYAPYNGILITAATPDIPPPLKGQLAEGGRIVAPVGGRDIQDLILLTRTRDKFRKELFGAVRFVPLIGEYGWSS